MAEIQMIALAASGYKVTNGGGEDIVMISVSFGAKLLEKRIVDVANTASAVEQVRNFYEFTKIMHPCQTFQINTRVLGRKPKGFDAARHLLNPSHFVETGK